jgi:hypothetical protein
MAEWFKAAVLTAQAGGRSEHRPQVDGQTAEQCDEATDNGEMAEWFKAAVLTAQAEGRSEHRPQVDGQTAEQCDEATDNGEMAEWFKAAVLKTAEGSNLPWVRIPLSPP